MRRIAFVGLSYNIKYGGVSHKKEAKVMKKKKQAYNPYLPSWEYIPDGEPYVFDGRVYIYGSHDYYNGYVFCMGVYV